MNSINILVEAKKEYTNQLQKILTPRLYEGFKSIYDDIINVLSKELEENKIQSSSTLKTFQKTLREIPQWNQDMIKNEYSRIEKLSNCDYFDNLVEAVFITNTKILTSVQINDNKPLNIKINIPQASYFIHKCYMESAKEIYKNPYIFDQSKNILPKEKHNNLREALNIIDNSINNAIRDLLPIRDILLQGLTKNSNEILNQDNEEEEEVEEEETIIDNSMEIIENNNEEIAENNNEEIEEHNNEEIVENNNEEIVENNNEENELEDNLNNDERNISELSNDVNTKSIILSIVPQEENKDIVETKEIFYNKVTPVITKKISTIQKIDQIKLIPDKPIIENPLLTPEVSKEYSELYPKKIIVPKKAEVQMGGNNPFLKKIPQKIFLKNKSIGADKNNSFYKKKYEENSANYNSVSDNLKDNNTIKSELTKKSDIKYEKAPSEVSQKKEKNKIILDGGSSDEEDNEDDIDI
jgi:hypothetical protein